MCGIVAYIGPQQAYKIIINGLKRLEYRGYDSAGIALINNGMHVHKTKGKVSDLEETCKDENVESFNRSFLWPQKYNRNRRLIEPLKVLERKLNEFV